MCRVKAEHNKQFISNRMVFRFSPEAHANSINFYFHKFPAFCFMFTRFSSLSAVAGERIDIDFTFIWPAFCSYMRWTCLYCATRQREENSFPHHKAFKQRRLPIHNYPLHDISRTLRYALMRFLFHKIAWQVERSSDPKTMFRALSTTK